MIFALRSKLDDIFAEGLENRYARHLENNKIVRDWGKSYGLELFPEEKYGSITLNCFKNTLNVDIVAVNEELKKRFNMIFNCGYADCSMETSLGQTTSSVGKWPASITFIPMALASKKS